MTSNDFTTFPPQRMENEFPWGIWAVGWLALVKAFLWVAYEPVQQDHILQLMGYKYLLNIPLLVIFGIGVWNLRRWAVWGILLVSIGNLVFFIVNSRTLNAVLVQSEVPLYSIILSIVTLLCNGPLGDFLILCAAPLMLKHTQR
ncbi:MAG: hypothetical protein JSW26_19615 [Desulfobacterales bacterium]|nr:MAG: hypothetical protein JSW26_19615 [Desulfobacterales bacterium]